MERLVLDGLWQHVKENNIIHCNQHGFQKNCSCVTQLIECLNDWIADYDKGLQTDIIYLDFCKAFDTVPHKRLLHKLKVLGIRGKNLEMVRIILK